MSATSLSAVIDALVDRLSGALSVPVYDGPQPVSPSSKQFVIVGGSETAGNDGIEAESMVSRSSMGNGELRDEQGAVTCSVWSWGGSTWSRDMRETALALLDECEAAVRADPSLGVLKPPFFAEFNSARIRQEQTSSGFLVRAVFAVTYTNLLTS